MGTNAVEVTHRLMGVETLIRQAITACAFSPLDRETLDKMKQLSKADEVLNRGEICFQLEFWYDEMCYIAVHYPSAPDGIEVSVC